MRSRKKMGPFPIRTGKKWGPFPIRIGKKWDRFPISSRKKMDRLPHQSDALLGRFCENPGSFCENPGRVLGGLWESSQDTLGEFWRHFGRARGQLLLQGIGRGQLGMHGTMHSQWGSEVFLRQKLSAGHPRTPAELS